MRCCGYALEQGTSKAAGRTLDDKAIVRPATLSECVAGRALGHGGAEGGWLHADKV